MQPAACRLILHAQLRIPRSPPLLLSVQEYADNWVPIFMGCLYSWGAYIREVLVRIEKRVPMFIYSQVTIIPILICKLVLH